MSTTLTNGLKLPDKGSVDWYADMQNNYAILDGAVGTVAEHTSALAGKAPLVHTHTKSDVTDLLNSNFIPSANNSYDLGSASNQWNNLYAKNYYYNGVAWGLDKKNVWTSYNVVNGYRFTIRQTSQEIGVIPASNQWNGFTFVDKNEANTISFQHAFLSSGETRFNISMVDNVASHDSNSTVSIELLRLTAYSGRTGFIIGADAKPMANNAYELGTTTNKWKSLNGINPGALGMPSTKSDRIALDITNWDKTNYTRNSYSVPVNGWMAVTGTAEAIQIENNTRGYGSTFTRGADNYCEAFLPVCEGDTFHCRIKNGETNVAAFLYPCLGNV